MIDNYPGIYRGTIVYNIDPAVKGRCKIFVHGVYPDEFFKDWNLLPWAEPAMPIAGGAWTNENTGLNTETGWCSSPHAGKSPETGAQVFVFFEANDINKPVYFAAAQSGPGWFAEHPNQHVFQSDNIRIRIDEQPNHPDSTCKFDTYNEENCIFSKDDGTKTEMQTRLDIEVLAKDINAVNIQIHGDVNMKILGDWYVHHEGDKHETHKGTHYLRHVGNTIIEEEGNTIYHHLGDYNRYIDGSVTETITENYNGSILADSTQNIGNRSEIIIGGDFDNLIGGFASYKVIGNESKNIGGNKELTVGKDSNTTIRANASTIIGGTHSFKANEDIEIVTKNGNIDIKTLGLFELMDYNRNITPQGYLNIRY